MPALFQFAIDSFLRAPLLWSGTIVLSVLLVVTLITRWGRTQPLGRCILLSLLGHLWLAACSTTVLVADRPGVRGETIIAISTLDLEEPVERVETPVETRPETKPVETKPDEPPEPVEPEPKPVEPAPEPAEPEARPVEPTPAKPLAEPPAADVLTSTAAPTEPPPLAVSDDLPVPAEPDEPLVEAAPEPQPEPAAPVATPAPTPAAPEPTPAAAPPQPPRPDVPALYQGRVEPNRAKLLAQAGGDERTEAAVQLALAWLAANQSADGRWDAHRHGAGRELQVNGRDRAGAGAKADTGVTGLALLAFLGAGHTHQHGEHRQAVAAGVKWLVRTQGSDGNLGGDAEVFSFMYCHGMAAYALAECYVLTRDASLEEPVRRALAYIVRSQHPVTGGWRYRPGDRGDTSVLGWQLMALKTGEAAGVAIPATARDGMVRFLHSVGRGRFGGLASYRPGEIESRSMTAEALASRQFLGMLRSNPAADEAGDYVLGDLPRADQSNYYYWYYATLAMHQLGGRHWETWNRALARTLVDTQVATGSLAGSWAPTDAWGGHGGRVYSTALATLSLEAYYRFLPPQAGGE